MDLTGIHVLLTYQCNLECDHCFVWGSPWQRGTMTLRQLRQVLQQAHDLGTVDWIYFEGGEPFLYYALMRQGVEEAARMGLRVGVVSNGYWATSIEDAALWLAPLAGLVQELAISSDALHWGSQDGARAEAVRTAAHRLGIPTGVIRIAQPVTPAPSVRGQLPPGESAVMFRGRAALKLANGQPGQPWTELDTCPFENLRQPSRVHVDPFGYVHICQGIAVGNLFETPLARICAEYDPAVHPVTGPLLDGGPAQLVRRYGLDHASRYADACHLCDVARRELRRRFPKYLAPDQAYGVES